jgi:hypothetical protein
MSSSSTHPFLSDLRAGDQTITHLAFADDILLLSCGDLSSIRCLLHQLTLFGQTSGLVINPQKSSIYFWGS